MRTFALSLCGKYLTCAVLALGGYLLWGDVELGGLKPEQRARAGLGHVPQERDIFPNLTVDENLRVGAIAQGRKLNGEGDRVFSLFPVLTEMLSRKGGEIAILLVEQHLDFCLDVGDRFYIMDRGSIMASGPIQQLNDDLVKQHLTV